MFSYLNKRKVDNKGVVVPLLITFLLPMLVSFFAVKFYEYELIKYIWFYIVLLVTLIVPPKFFLELVFAKCFNEILLAHLVVIVFCALYFEMGGRAIVLGLGFGITIMVVLLLGTYYPIFLDWNKKRK